MSFPKSLGFVLLFLPLPAISSGQSSPRAIDPARPPKGGRYVGSQTASEPSRLLETTIADVHAAYKSGRLTAHELVQLYLAFVPMITVPAGFTSDNLPIGITFQGRPYSDGLVSSGRDSYMRGVIVAITLGASVGVAVALAQGGDARTVKDGVYAEQQAARGKDLFNKNCASCHQEDLSGKAISDSSGAPALKGETFVANWADINIDDLLTRTKTTMPYDNPDSLMRQMYVDIIAYLLKTNEFPAGQKELPIEAEALKAITITKK